MVNFTAVRTIRIACLQKETEDGILLSEFLVKMHLPWAGKHNVINAALTHHLNEFRWLGCADMLMDYVDFFINGDGAYDASGSAFAMKSKAALFM